MACPSLVAVRPLAAAFVALTSMAGAGHAQGSLRTATPSAGALACLANLAPGVFTTIPVYLTYTAPARSSAAAVEQVRYVVQDAAARVRAALEAGQGQLPSAEGRLSFLDLSATATLVLFGDGRARIREAEEGAAPDSAGHALLRSALRTAIDSGGAFPWSPVAAESARVEFAFGHATVGRGGPQPLQLAFGVPVFSLRVPWEEPVAQQPGPGPAYPDAARRAGIEGEVVAEFVVREDGHADPATFTVVRRQASDQAMLGEFEASVRAALPRMAFVPANVGGCAVARLVRQPFVFALR